jgi:hypothetical protein
LFVLFTLIFSTKNLNPEKRTQFFVCRNVYLFMHFPHFTFRKFIFHVGIYCIWIGVEFRLDSQVSRRLRISHKKKQSFWKEIRQINFH